MATNPNFRTDSRLRATITEILEKVNGVNEDTGEAYIYFVVGAKTEKGTDIKENIFVDKFNDESRIAVGNVFDVVYSTNLTTGKVKGKCFMASKYASTAQKLQESGASADVVEAGKQQARSAMDAVRARQAARAGAVK